MLDEVDLELAREGEDIIINSYKFIIRKIREGLCGRKLGS
jgi:hypothetical protein